MLHQLHHKAFELVSTDIQFQTSELATTQGIVFLTETEQKQLKEPNQMCVSKVKPLILL